MMGDTFYKLDPTPWLEGADKEPTVSDGQVIGGHVRQIYDDLIDRLEAIEKRLQALDGKDRWDD